MKNQTEKTNYFSHDTFFKSFYSDPKLSKELLQLIFSKEELEIYDLEKLKVEKDTFEDKRADLVLSFPFKAFPKIRLRIFILLEHKSSYDKNLY
ncbi:MAG: Rpn family recombination-promoting nuclease/putative transposase, partial [Bdellovibrionales bacterium]|nr:Rpn family recombination-promoting nuclease/putative transposase [Bdellovibrionales bacterium]